MPGRKIFCVVLFFLFAVVLPAQNTGPYFHHLTAEEGLSQGTNHFLYKDSKGFIWLSSLDGLNRYDGKQVKVYRYDPEDSTSVFGQIVQGDIVETKDRNLWFATFEGLNYYDRKQDKFYHYVPKAENGVNLQFFYIFHLDDNENLWVIVDSKWLYHFHIPTKKFIYKHSFKQDVLRVTAVTDSNGVIKQALYLGFRTPGIFMVDYEDGEMTGSAFKLGEDSAQPALIRKALPDGDNIWLATTSGLALYQPHQDKLQFFHTSESVKSELCASIAWLNKDKILAPIKGKGLMVFSVSEKRFVEQYSASPTNPNSLSNNDPDAIFVDSDGGVWVSFDNLGVDFFHPDKQKFKIIKPGDSTLKGRLSFDVRTMIEDENGQIWSGTNLKGITIYNVEKQAYRFVEKTDNPAPEGQLTNIVKFFRDSKKRIWVLGYSGISVWLPDKEKLIAVPELTEVYLDGCQLRNGKIILSAYKGGLFELKELPGNKFYVEEIKQVDRKFTFVSLWEDSNGRLFACASLTELWVMEPNQDFRVFQKIPLQGRSTSFAERPGDPSIWVANSFGLAHLTLNNGKFDYTLYNEKDGLASSVNYSLLTDNEGKIWIGTGRGISSFDPRRISFNNYGITDGVSALQFNAFAVVKRKDGQLMFGSTDGITAFYPDKIKPISVPAHPAITQILINDQEDSSLVCDLTGAVNPSEIKSLRLDFQRNTLSFNFAALEYSQPLSTKFRYKMEGYDPDWVEAGVDNFARYARIPPGSYTFSIMASNSDGIWSNIQSIALVIEPPFTQTPMFYVLVGLAILALGMAYVQYRRNKRMETEQREAEKRRALESERQRIARDVHDDLGSGLSALSLLTEIAGYKDTKEELKTDLSKINSASRELSGKIREVIWTVNSSNDSLASLISYMNQYALELLDNAGIDYHVSIPEHIPDFMISGEYRRTLFLAFKEALNNTLKHAEATKVAVDFSIEEGVLLISVKDNGKGFDPQLLLASTGNGLLNMQARMLDIQGETRFKTSNRGTQVSFYLNLQEKQF